MKTLDEIYNNLTKNTVTENKTKLVEIKKDEEGHGLLIEHDGYISSSCGDNKKLFEDIKANESTEFFCPNPFIVSAVFQKFGIKNANGRIYPENILKKEVEKYQQKIAERRAIGECNHPSESVIDLSRVAINIVELHWEGRTLIGKLEILVSEGYRRHGVISCQGDQIAHLLLNGIKIGVSSRGLGTVTNRMGTLIVGDDFELVCWDVVSDPSTPNAWVSSSYDDLKPYVEAKIDEKPLIFEIDSQLNNWLND
jgi:hypothetical protein